jgi:hypothetical protein
VHSRSIRVDDPLPGEHGIARSVRLYAHLRATRGMTSKLEQGMAPNPYVNIHAGRPSTAISRSGAGGGV